MATTAEATRPDDHRGAAPRTYLLQERLRALGCDQRQTEAAMATCVVWVADALVALAVTHGAGLGARHVAGAAAEVLAQVVTDAGAGSAGPVTGGQQAGPLTGREREVLVALQRDDPLRQIAEGLFISHNTVKSHTRALYRKLGASSRAEAVARGRELRLLPRAGGPGPAPPAGPPGPPANGAQSSSSSLARRPTAVRAAPVPWPGVRRPSAGSPGACGRCS